MYGNIPLFLTFSQKSVFVNIVHMISPIFAQSFCSNFSIIIACFYVKVIFLYSMILGFPTMPMFVGLFTGNCQIVIVVDKFMIPCLPSSL